MKATEAKTAATSHSLQAKGGAQQPFFQQQEERQGAFFGNEPPAAKPFFTPFIQTKLTIGQPGDKYEQEADAMAEQVVQRMADGDQLAGGRSAVGSGAQVQRKCAECEQEERLQKKEGEEADAILPKIQKKSIFEGNDERPGGTIQAKSDGALLEASSDLESRLNASRGSGQALPEDTRGSMESAFGADFSSVRVHTGSEAVQMNQELGAQAFTHGSDVYFGAGKYDPGSREGNRLLGHELTHVVQQGGDKISTFADSFVNKTEYHSDRLTIPLLGNKDLKSESSPTSYKGMIQPYRIKVPDTPLCGRTLTHIDIEPPRWRELSHCFPDGRLVYRMNIVGRQVSAATTGRGRIIFNLHAGYFVDPTTGKYCAVVDDSENCVTGQCQILGCFPTLEEVAEAIKKVLEKVLDAIGIILLIIIAIIIAIILRGGRVPSTGPTPVPTFANNEGDNENQLA